MRFRLGIRASSAGASVKSRPVEQSGGSGRSRARVLCRKLRRFSCAVATSRVGDRSPTSRPSGREVGTGDGAVSRGILSRKSQFLA
jgi:hypothetical protein